MNTRVLTVINSALIASALTLGMPHTGYAWQSAEQEQSAETEDILHMTDGRVLRGQIISEKGTEVVFEYRDDNLKIKTTLTLKRENIALIERDQPMTSKPAAEDPKPSSSSKYTPRPSGSTQTSTTSTSNYGITRVTEQAEGVASIYVVPLKGQMGTDIRSSEYKAIVEDIKAVKPDVVVLEVHCSDTSDMMFPEGYETPPVDQETLEKIRQREWGMLDFDDYRAIVHLFRNDLRDFKQVVWVHDSDGVSATVFMAWDNLYMAPGGRLGSRVSMLDQTNAKRWGDPDVRAKMIAAVLGITKGFLERGGYSLTLADAMLDVEPKLSGEWRGREVIWSLHDGGQYVVDSSDKHTAYFTAKTAEDFCISDGTAETIDDLALLLGYREFRLIESKQKDIDGYVEAWRRSYKDTQVAFQNYAQYMGWVGGDEAAKWLGKAKSELESIVRAMDRYPAIEVRWERDYGIPKLYFITTIERIKEQLIALKRSRSTGGGGAGGGGRTGRGGSGAR